MASLVALTLSVAAAADAATGSDSALLANYPPLKAKLEKNQFGAPIYIDSKEGTDSVQVDIYGVFNHPFEAVSDALRSPASWCDFTPLHINIKACTSKKVADVWYVIMYTGRKYYQAPADAKPIKFVFKVISQTPRYLQLNLAADQGPLYTKDHRILVEAAPLDAGRTFVHFGYAYKYGSMARMAIKTYFATIARDKVGFSLVRDSAGKPGYIQGVRGSVERNTVRYYLALESYLDTLQVPPAQRFEQRLNRWYELTAKYPRQLKEMEKSEYVAEKRREHGNQIILQRSEGGLAANPDGEVSEVVPGAGDAQGTAWCRLASSKAAFDGYAAARLAAGQSRPQLEHVCSLR